MAEFHPIPITALAKSDADGTSGGNIVAGAVITVQDLSGSTAIIYDDESGSGGATSKTTNADGQVDLYVSPGEYNVFVNGGSPRRYSAGGKSAYEVDTFANLQILRPSKTGQSFICQERANARYILQASGYVALPGDVTFANGRVGQLQIDGWMNIECFGATQGVDATAEIQDAFDRAEFVYAIGYDYRYTQLTVSSSLKFVGAGKKKTRLRTTNLTLDKITVTADGSHSVIFADMEFSTIGTQTGGSALAFNSSTTQLQNPVVSGCNFVNMYNCIDMVNSAQFNIKGCYFVSYINFGVRVNNDIEPDSGDSTITENVFDAGATSGDAIVQIASGGLRVVNNKFLNGEYHYRSAFSSALDTSILVWTGNSSEQASVANIAFNGTNPNAFSYVNISGGNQFSVANGATAILVNDPGYDFLRSSHIEGNVFNLSSNARAMNIGRLQNSTIGRNTIIGNGTNEFGVIIGANSSGLKISQQTMVSVATEYSLAGSYEFTDWQVESGSETGSTSSAFGSLYATPTITVTFAKAYPVAPKVQATAVNSNGAISALASNITTTGFALNIIGLNSTVSVTANWTATL